MESFPAEPGEFGLGQGDVRTSALGRLAVGTDRWAVGQAPNVSTIIGLAAPKG